MADFFSGFASTFVPMYAQGLDNADKKGAAGTFANALKGYKSATQPQVPQQQDQLPPQPGQTTMNPLIGETNPIAAAAKLYNLDGFIASIMPFIQGGNQQNFQQYRPNQSRW